ncbi:hydroxyethylthiazole kinase [Megasphaera vaginalis (ex Srinivasan et al. 2021)]|uniref:Hydroxyethylthiazole kinase n=1 Tax=Megasphaera vaginalis (ex Srinivasan et al. 2021) TaxID=1111454 RepID=U7UIJ9_9FIRM|nr:hydroxyethylthiazole kinase [Megasphaera vaginalis (ex Srinivasan et al. 2021)]ERT59150.1 putative hydroxyethylthiazole kinase [Megasphaera vaginalis (ex Srinivasan et al. 2021)]
MPNNLSVAADLIPLRRRIETEKPLIHCLSHPITMNDCANLVLAVGGTVSMASHCREVEEVVSQARALAVNLGNITDERMEAMRLAGSRAASLGIPTLIDVTGISTSTLRKNFAVDFISACRPCVIKGNSSEILTLAGLPQHGIGIDAGAEDLPTRGNYEEKMAALTAYATKTTSVVVMSGPVDIIAAAGAGCAVANGTPLLARLTGTGCMLGVLIAVYTAVGTPFRAAILGTVTLGIAGEIAAAAGPGLGSFHSRLFDALSTLTDEQICRGAHILQAK